MDISKIKIAWKYLTGGMGAVTDYLLEVGNKALAAIDPGTRKTVAAALNTLARIGSTLRALEWLCPTRWQYAYGQTLLAVVAAVDALLDFTVTPAELTKVRDGFNAAVQAWRAGDVPDTDCDFTCVED